MKHCFYRSGIGAALISVLVLCLLFCGCGRGNDPATPSDAAPDVVSGSDMPSEAETVPEITGMDMLPGVYVSDLFPYTGKYVEDGSDEAVADLAAVTLTNYGATDYLYIEFTVTTDSGVYAFTASSLHAGMRLTVLSKEKKTVAATEALTAADCPIHAEYQTPPTMCEDLFSFTQATGSFNIRNVSGRDLNGTITVYYKYADENGFIGGITFRTVLHGLKAEEEQWSPSGHMGRIVFVTYEE